MGQKYTNREIAALKDYRAKYYTRLSQRAFARKVFERSRDNRSDARTFFGRSVASIYAAVRRLDARIQEDVRCQQLIEQLHALDRELA